MSKPPIPKWIDGQRLKSDEIKIVVKNLNVFSVEYLDDLFDSHPCPTVSWTIGGERIRLNKQCTLECRASVRVLGFESWFHRNLFTLALVSGQRKTKLIMDSLVMKKMQQVFFLNHSSYYERQDCSINLLTLKTISFPARISKNGKDYRMTSDNYWIN